MKIRIKDQITSSLLSGMVLAFTFYVLQLASKHEGMIQGITETITR